MLYAKERGIKDEQDLGHRGHTELPSLVWRALLHAVYVTEINHFLMKSHCLFTQPDVFLIGMATADICWFIIEVRNQDEEQAVWNEVSVSTFSDVAHKFTTNFLN